MDSKFNPKLPRKVKKALTKYYGSEAYSFWKSIQIEPLNIKFTSVYVQTKTRQLRVDHSVELAEELYCYAGIDLEEELVSTLQIPKEI